MIDRDYFAAAALTRGMGVLGCEQIAKSCYEMADAMLQERERTNHDAVPAARAEEPESSVPLGSGSALANTLEPSNRIADLVDEVARLRLTDEEREAVEWFAEVRKPLTRLTQSHNREKYKDTLCGLLEKGSK